MNAITPFPIVEVALSKLDPSPANVRKTGRDAGIEELAASIEAHGLLQSLLVRPKGRGRYEVVAGQRRHAALRLLASRKRLSKTAPIVCWKLDPASGASGATEASLAENAMRRDMHPADEFEAFALLHRGGEGLGVEEIGARYGVTPAVVRQRLRLAEVSPAILAAYREGALTLDDVMAFAVTDDHATQERVWGDLLPWQRSPATIRRLLTQALLPTTDKRVRLVGLDAYEAAGGRVQRDLFTEDGGGWIADPAILETLVGVRMEAEAETLRAEGWRWVAVGDAASAEAYRCRRVWPVRTPLTEAEEARRDEVAARYDEVAADYGDTEDLPPEIADELARLDAELAALNRREEVWRPEDVALAGCVLTLAGDGRLSVTRGLVRPEDEPKPEPSSRRRMPGRMGTRRPARAWGPPTPRTGPKPGRRTRSGTTTCRPSPPPSRPNSTRTAPWPSAPASRASRTSRCGCWSTPSRATPSSVGATGRRWRASPPTRRASTACRGWVTARPSAPSTRRKGASARRSRPTDATCGPGSRRRTCRPCCAYWPSASRVWPTAGTGTGRRAGCGRK